MRILVFGMGIVANTYLNAYPDVEKHVIGYVQTMKGTQMQYRNKPVYELNSISSIEFDEIHIANSHYETVNQALSQGIDKNKLVLCYIGLVREYIATNDRLDVRFSLPAILTSKFFHSSIPGDEIFSFCGNQIIVNDDYCRVGTLHLLIEEVKNRNVEGNLAELGVYQGNFAKHLNREFNDRKLYLFDTFEGFSKEEENENIQKGYSTVQDIENSSFVDTSVQAVLEKMSNPDQVVICKGLFPNSIPKSLGGDERYALVSLDCDLYIPILEGLRYFYPRLSKGGYIMIHDYNNDKFSVGIKKAVNEFEMEYGKHIPKVPIPDEEGTLVITK